MTTMMRKCSLWVLTAAALLFAVPWRAHACACVIDGTGNGCTGDCCRVTESTCSCYNVGSGGCGS